MFQKKLIIALKLCAFLIFIGRGYQYIFFDAPFRAFFWDENLLQSVIENNFNISWNDYVTSTKVDRYIQKSITINGFLFIWAAIASIFITRKNRKWHLIPIGVGTFMLFILSLLSMKESFFHYGQFFEQAIQVGVPFVLLYITRKPNPQSYTSSAGSVKNKVLIILKILIAITFTSHGLYALGYYPVPGYFIDMTILTTNLSESNATTLLYVAGILDIIISVLIFIPKVSKYALIYACVWGFLTAFARIVANFNMDFFMNSLHQAAYQTIYRLPHGIIPFIIYKLSTTAAAKPAD